VSKICTACAPAAIWALRYRITVFAILFIRDRYTSGAWYMSFFSWMKFFEVPPSTM